jgi:hypothetical protein
VYTRKTEEQLAWDLIKAAARAKVNLETAAYRNRRMNDLLSELWPLFEASLAGEELLTIDPEFDAWVRDAVAGIEIQVTQES